MTCVRARGIPVVGGAHLIKIAFSCDNRLGGKDAEQLAGGRVHPFCGLLFGGKEC